MRLVDSLESPGCNLTPLVVHQPPVLGAQHPGLCTLLRSTLVDALLELSTPANAMFESLWEPIVPSAKQKV